MGTEHRLPLLVACAFSCLFSHGLLAVQARADEPATSEKAADRVYTSKVRADKADTLAAVLQGPRDVQTYPSQGVTGADVCWLVDEAAAARLVPGVGDGR